MARFRAAVERGFFDAGFAPRRVDVLADFVTAFRLGAAFDFLAVALPGVRFFAGDVFAFVLRLAG